MALRFQNGQSVGVDHDEAVLVTGLYGSGKSSLVAEMAERLEMADVPFGAIDVDWLTWYHLPTGADPAADLRAQNLSDVANRYLANGVQRLLLADAVTTDAEVDSLRRLIPCPVRVVRLDVPVATIERRLQADPTTGRAHDLDVARDWAQRQLGRVDADLVLDGEAPLSRNAGRVLTWLRWLPDATP